jgi:hypothetical protein
MYNKEPGAKPFLELTAWNAHNSQKAVDSVTASSSNLPVSPVLVYFIDEGFQTRSQLDLVRERAMVTTREKTAWLQVNSQGSAITCTIIWNAASRQVDKLQVQHQVDPETALAVHIASGRPPSLLAKRNLGCARAHQRISFSRKTGVQSG